MVEVIKTYRQAVPATRFIGKKYGDPDRVNGGFGKQWGEWHANGWFGDLEKAYGEASEFFENSGAYVGLMRWKDGEPFEYWIGMYFPEGASVPEGYEYRDFEAGFLGVGWLRGKENEIYGVEEKCSDKLKEEGIKIKAGKDGAWWFFERYTCPRFTTPDENGNVILDICFFAE